MPQAMSELNRRVQQTANRLRLLQVDFADAPAEERRKHLAREVRRALAGASDEERRRFLNRLGEHFPRALPGSRAREDAAPAPGPPVSEEEQLHELISLVGSLPPEAREDLARRLAEAGLPVRRASSGSSAMTEVLEVEAVPAERMARSLVLLAWFSSKLDQHLKKVWGNLGVSGGAPYEGDAMAVLKRFLARGTDDDAAQLETLLSHLRRTLLALLAALKPTLQKFASRHARFAPSEIQALARIDGKHIYESWELKYWKKYAEVGADMNQGTIEQEFMEAYRQFVADLLKTGRKKR
jgi:hypothetical protein